MTWLRIPRPRRWPVLATALVAVLVAGLVVWVHRPGRSEGPGTGRRPGGADLHLLACDDLADMEGLLARFTRDTGLRVDVEYQSIDQLLRTASSPGFDGSFDAVWVPVNGTQPFPEAIEGHLETGTAVMSSPLVLGLRERSAIRIGARGSSLTWRDLVTADGPDRFTFGMVGSGGADTANRDESAALLGIAAGLAGTQDVLTPHEIYLAAPALRALHDRQALSAPTSAELVREFQEAAATGVDAILTHESQVLGINAARGSASPLAVVAPGRQAVFTRYVLRPLLNPRSPTKWEGMRSLADYLMTGRSQEWIARHTFRRPATIGSATQRWGFASIRDVQTPRLQGVSDRIVNVYKGDFHYPRIVFVLDISGSMRGQGMNDMRHAFTTLGRTIAARSGTDVQVLLAPFATTPSKAQAIELNAANPDPGMALLARSIDRLEPGGNTALYAALQEVDEETARRARDGDTKVTSIILVTDGANTADTDLAAFRRHRATLQHRWCAGNPPEVCRVPVFPVLVGGVDPVEMRQLAATTGGRVMDARTTNLGPVLRDLTGEAV